MGTEVKINFIDDYLPLIEQRARYKVYHGGRGSAKSYQFALALLLMGREEKIRILCAREVQQTIRDSVHRLLVDQVALYHFEEYRVQKEGIVNQITGTEFLFKGLRSNPQEIKSLQGIDICWVEEGHAVTEESWNILLPTIRKDNSEIWITYNRLKRMDPVHEMFVENERPKSIVRHLNYYDNPYCPKVLLEEAAYDKTNNPGLYRHKWLGEPLEANEDALWNWDMILYRKDIPTLKRTVVAIDPAVSTEKNSDETGITVCAQGADDQYYILEDLSGKYTPNEWASVANNAFERHKADLIVAEKNQGGDLVKQNLLTVNRNLPVKLVHAAKGKYIRAEPIANLYQQKKVYHAEPLTYLENQMVSFKIDIDRKSNGSPDRVDSLVWGLTELALTSQVRIRSL